MSIAFLLLGKTNVAFFDATASTRVSTTVPRSGALGAFDDLVDAVGQGTGPTALFSTDVSVQEDHSLRAEITSFPVESGGEVTDNIRTLPRELTISGLITDTPSGLDAVLIVPGLIDRFASVPRSIAGFQLLEELWKRKALLDVVTSLKVYQNMVIEDVSIPRNAQVGRSFQFTIKLKEIEFATSATVTAGGFDGLGTAELGATAPLAP